MVFGNSKRAILGLAAGVVMSLGLVAPTLADNGTVAVTGSNGAKLIFTIGNTVVSSNTSSGETVAFGSIDPSGGLSGCFQGDHQVSFSIKSNRSYSGDVGAVAATTSGHSDIPVSQLYWKRNAAADCTTSTAFSASGTWFGPHASTANDSFTNGYALQDLWTNTDGTVDMTLTYTVTQA